MLNKTLAGFFAFFLGVFGVHRFYLGQPGRGALQFGAFCGTLALLADEGPEMPFPFILMGLVVAPIITAIVFWATPYERWAAKYDPEALVSPGYAYPKSSRRPTYRRPPAARPSLRDLKAEGIKYYRTGDFDLAEEAFAEALEQLPADPVTHFNLACCHALQGKFPEALRELEIAVTYDLPKPERILHHPALRELRQRRDFLEFRRNNFRQRDFIELVGDDPDDSLTLDGEQLNDLPRNHDLLEQISRLRELHDAGILTQLEYKTQREKLLG